MAGRPVMLPKIVNATIWITGSAGSPGDAWTASSTVPTGGGSIDSVGVSRTSKSRPQWATISRLRICSP